MMYAQHWSLLQSLCCKVENFERVTFGIDLSTFVHDSVDSGFSLFAQPLGSRPSNDSKHTLMLLVNTKAVRLSFAFNEFNDG